MGCLPELLFELLFDVIFSSWEYAMGLIVPRKSRSSTAHKVLKAFVSAFCCLLFLCMVFGVIAVLSDDRLTRTVGKYCLLISLVLSAIQIIVGVIVKIARKKK